MSQHKKKFGDTRLASRKRIPGCARSAISLGLLHCALFLLWVDRAQAAYPIGVLVRNRDASSPFTNMTSTYRMAVNNRGDWVARLAVTTGDVVVKNGSILLDGNELNSVFTLSINNLGDVVTVLYRNGAAVGEFSNGHQVYFNQTLLATPGQTTTVPGYPSGLTYESLYDAAVNDAREVFVVGYVVGSGGEQALNRFRVDGAGHVLEETTVFTDGDPIMLGQDPGQLFNPTRYYWQWEPNNGGNVLVRCSFFLDTGSSVAVLLLNMQPVFRGGAPSSIPGRTNKIVQAAHLNNRGDWVAQVGFTVGDSKAQMLMRNGQKVLELGDTLPNGGVISKFREPVFLDDEGSVFGIGQWTDSGQSTHESIFLNDLLLVDHGVTELAGRKININVGGTGGPFSVSDNGRHLIFGGFFTDGEAALFHIAIPPSSAAGISRFSSAGDAAQILPTPRDDVRRIRLIQSQHLSEWMPPNGDTGAWVDRPSGGWSQTNASWRLQPSSNAFYRVEVNTGP